LARDPYQLQPEQHHENKEMCSRMDEQPEPEPKKPCPHPDAEVSRFDGMILCHHCWALLDNNAFIATPPEEHTRPDEVLDMPAA